MTNERGVGEGTETTETTEIAETNTYDSSSVSGITDETQETAGSGTDNTVDAAGTNNEDTLELSGTNAEKSIVIAYNHPVKLSVNKNGELYEQLTYKTSNSKIVTVDENGYITGKNIGQTTLDITDSNDPELRLAVNVRCRIYNKDAEFIAHRGYSSQKPENTVPAFEAAMENGFTGVEMDVWESKHGGTMFISHDYNLKAKTGKKKKIWNLTLSNRKKYKIKRGKGIKKYGKLLIPTLNESLNAVYETAEKIGNDNPVVELDIKSHSGYRISNRAIKKIVNLCGDHHVHVLCDKMSVAKRFKKFRKSNNMQIWYGPIVASKISAAGRAHLDGYSAKQKYASKAVITKAHSKELEIGFYWPGNVGEKRVKMLYDYGATRFNIKSKVFTTDSEMYRGNE